MLFSVNSMKAQVWGPLGNGVEGDPVTYEVYKGVMVMLVDKGHNQNGRVFSLVGWNGIFWTHISSFQADSGAIVRSMKFFPNTGKLYMAGKFRSVRNALGARNIVAYNFETRRFEKVEGLDNTTDHFTHINDLEVWQGHLMVGGLLGKAGNIESQNLHAFNGKTWTAINLTKIGKGFDNGEVRDLVIVKDTLFVSGDFNKVNGIGSQNLAGLYGPWIGLSVKYYRFNGVNPYKVGVYDNKLFAVHKISNEFFMYGLTEKGFNRKFSLPAKFTGVQDVREHEGNLWVSGEITLMVDSKLKTVNLAMFDGDKWLAAPGYDKEYKIEFFMLYERGNNELLLGAGEAFVDKTLRIIKTGILNYKRGVVAGKIYYDKDGNCKMGHGDEIVTNRLIRVRPGPYYTKPDENGYYRLFLPYGEYTVDVIQGPYWGVSSCAQSKLVFELDEDQNAYDQDFPLNFVKTVEDVSVKLTSYSGWLAKKGNVQRYNLKAENLGSEQIKDGKIELTFNTELDASFKSSPAPDTIDDNRAVYLVRSIKSGETLNIPFSLELPDNFNENNLEIVAEVEPSKNESATDDNESTITQEINDSTYENSKQVFPSPDLGETMSKIDPDEGELQYLINFANYSNDTVKTLRVIDTIDVNLDIKYIQETGSSHNYTTRVINGPPGSNIATIIWTFEDLDLVPNPERYNDMPGYSGYIGFKVQLNQNVPLGTIIENQAALQFDYQHTEMTNLVQTQVTEITSTEEIESENGNIVLYPNPSESSVYLVPNEEGLQLDPNEIEVLDLQGRMVNAPIDGDAGRIHIDMKEVAQGLYVVQGMTSSGVFRKTVIIK